MHPKAPVVVPQKPLRGYMFGYGGITATSKYNALGQFTPTPNAAAAVNGATGVNAVTTTTTTTRSNAWAYDQAVGVTTTGATTTGGGGGTTGGGGGGGLPTLVDIPMMFNLDDGWAAGFGFGLYSDFLGGSRFEIEGAYDKVALNNFMFNGFQLPADVEFTTRALMFNWLKEIPFGSATGYFGPGIGWAETEIYGQTNGVPYSDSASGFAWQLIAGIDIPMNETLALFMQYRYRVLSEQTFVTEFDDFSLTTQDDPSSHALLFGARVSF